MPEKKNPVKKPAIVVVCHENFGGAKLRSKFNHICALKGDSMSETLLQHIYALVEKHEEKHGTIPDDILPLPGKGRRRPMPRQKVKSKKINPPPGHSRP